MRERGNMSVCHPARPFALCLAPTPLWTGGNNENEASLTWFSETMRNPHRFASDYSWLFTEVVRQVRALAPAVSPRSTGRGCAYTAAARACAAAAAWPGPWRGGEAGARFRHGTWLGRRSCGTTYWLLQCRCMPEGEGQARRGGAQGSVRLVHHCGSCANRAGVGPCTLCHSHPAATDVPGPAPPRPAPPWPAFLACAGGAVVCFRRAIRRHVPLQRHPQHRPLRQAVRTLHGSRRHHMA